MKIKNRKRKPQDKKELKTDSTSLVITTDRVYNYKENLFSQIDDNKLIIGSIKNRFKSAVYIFLIILLIAILFHFTTESIGKFQVSGYIIGFMLLYTFLQMIICLILDIVEVRRQNIITFNRLEETINVQTFSNSYIKIKTYPFRKTKMIYCNYDKFPQKGVIYINGKYTSLFERLITDIPEAETEACISFFIWYMDKNRPLPPNQVFGPYREKDFLRRKAEGFPPPLFPSKIFIPEYEPQAIK